MSRLDLMRAFVSNISATKRALTVLPKTRLLKHFTDDVGRARAESIRQDIENPFTDGWASGSKPGKCCPGVEREFERPTRNRIAFPEAHYTVDPFRSRSTCLELHLPPYWRERNSINEAACNRLRPRKRSVSFLISLSIALVQN